MTTFCPILHRAPIRQFFIMCEKCQIFVPGRIRQGSSTYEDSWTKKLSGSNAHLKNFTGQQQPWRTQRLSGQARRSVGANVGKPVKHATLRRRFRLKCGALPGAERKRGNVRTRAATAHCRGTRRECLLAASPRTLRLTERSVCRRGPACRSLGYPRRPASSCCQSPPTVAPCTDVASLQRCELVCPDQKADSRG